MGDALKTCFDICKFFIDQKAINNEAKSFVSDLAAYVKRLLPGFQRIEVLAADGRLDLESMEPQLIHLGKCLENSQVFYVKYQQGWTLNKFYVTPSQIREKAKTHENNTRNAWHDLQGFLQLCCIAKLHPVQPSALAGEEEEEEDGEEREEEQEEQEEEEVDEEENGDPEEKKGEAAPGQAPPPPASTKDKAYVGFSVKQSGDPRDPDYIVANVTAESSADQQGLTQGDKIQAINNKDIRGMHEEEVKQMLIGEPFSTVKIVTASKTVEIERDCAVPEPEAGGPMVGGANMYASYGGYQSMAMPMPPQAGYYPPRCAFCHTCLSKETSGITSSMALS